MAITQASEEGLKISNAGTNGQYLQKQSGNTGGLTWADVNTDLVSDTSPQLGGDLDTNSFEISLDDDHKVKFGASDDLYIWHNSSTGNSNVTNITGDLYIQGNNGSGAAQNQIAIKSNAAVELNYQGSKTFETTSAGIEVTGRIALMDSSDNTGAGNALWLGAGNDLKIYHDGTHSNAVNATGELRLRSDDLRLQNNAATHNYLKGANGGAVELYHNNTKRFETTNSGVLIGDSNLCKFGTDSDAYISHTGSDFVILNSTGTLAIGNNSGTGVGEGSIVFKSGTNQSRWSIESGGNFLPSANNAFAIGSSSNRVSIIYANTSLNTSDKTLKNTITTSDLGLDFINKLKPVSYKWNQYEGEISDTKTHYGLIAQDVEEVITSSGKTLNDFGGVDKSDEGRMGLAYSQFISPLIKAVQELSAEVETLKTKVAALEAK